MPKETCKTDHAAVTTNCCPECGAQLRDPDDERIGGMIRENVKAVLREAGLLKDDKKEDKKENKPSIAERFGGKGEKK